MKIKTRILGCAFGVLVCLGSVGYSQTPSVEEYLTQGKLSEGELALEKHLAENPKDDQARFGLGTIRLMQSVEHLAQSWYKYGIADDMNRTPFFRLPVPSNENPEKVNYQDVRNVFKNMIQHLDGADEVLAEITDKNVKLPLHLLKFQIDINADGKVTDDEKLDDIIRQYMGRAMAINDVKRDELVVAFDYSDVLWMRGYTHLLRSMLEFALAYDHEPLWDVISHRVFEKVDFKFEFLEEELEARGGKEQLSLFDQFTIMDIIGGIHNLNFKLKNPARMKRAHSHLKSMVKLSREMWVSINHETDNDREWIPNVQQNSAVSEVEITKEMLGAWTSFLDELDGMLDGEKLIPFWRGTDKTRGVNLKRFFQEPRDLDLVLWAHGSGATPYVEYGDVTQKATWDRFGRVFRGQFVGFAVWFN